MDVSRVSPSVFLLTAVLRGRYSGASQAHSEYDLREEDFLLPPVSHTFMTVFFLPSESHFSLNVDLTLQCLQTAHYSEPSYFYPLCSVPAVTMS